MTAFTKPRDPSAIPYHLKNGKDRDLAEEARHKQLLDRFEADLRKPAPPLKPGRTRSWHID